MRSGVLPSDDDDEAVGSGVGSCWTVGRDGIGLERPDCGWAGVDDPERRALWYSMMLKMLLGSLLDVMIVVTPAAVAMSAAMSFVSIPPVPRLEPSVDVLTGCESRVSVGLR